MSKRINTEREKLLEPKRYGQTISDLASRGYLCEVLDDKHFRFLYRGEWVTYYPYSGWATERR